MSTGSSTQPPLRVAIDVTSGVNQGAGVGRVTREAVTALAARPEPLDLRLFYTPEGTPVARAGERWLAELATRSDRVRVRRLPFPARWTARLWLRLRLPLPVELVAGRVDLLLAPNFVAPPTAWARTIVTIHDLSYLAVPQYADPGLRRYLSGAVPRSLRRAAHVVAVSETTRREAIERLGLTPDRVSVVYNGVDPAFRPLPPATVDEVRGRLALPERFILTLGTLEPRKNHRGLIQAFARLLESEPAVSLLVAGRRGWLDEPIFRAVEELGLQSSVRFLGGVEDADLPALLNATSVVAYPSFYEGFGLPPLEAMACGTPVVTSTGGALPEVCGEAALLVDPADTAGLADALRRALMDRALRATLRERGLRRAAGFTWANTAAGLVEVFRRVRENSGSR